jgi:hypothetical protein
MLSLAKATLTFQEVFHRNNINALQFQIERNDLISLIGKILVKFISKYNFNRNMTEMQIVSTAESISQLYKHLTLEDLHRCFTKAVAGQYGNFYEGLDEPKILNLLSQYDQQRDEELIKFRAEESKEHKLQSKEMLTVNNEAIAQFQKIRESLEAKKVVLNTPVERVKTEGEILQQKILAEFDTLYKTLGTEIAGVRHLKIIEDFMQVSDYLEFRYLQELDKIENNGNNGF